MSIQRSHRRRLLIISTILFSLNACAQTTDGDDQQLLAVKSNDTQNIDTESEKQDVRQRYVSAKQVSSDCGVEFAPPPPPGFAEVPGVEPRALMKPMASSLAVGADRALVDTDWESVSPGYILIEPASVRDSFLLNNEKEIVATFSGRYYTGFSQLLANGNRLVSSHGRTNVFHSGGYRGCVEEYSTDGELLWRLNLNTDNYIHHHDVVKLDNGHILAVVWEKVAAAEALSLGRHPDDVAKNGEFWYDAVIEVDPYTQDIVWEWSARHHLIQDVDPGKPNYGVVADHPERIDINQFRPSPSGNVSPDWTHINSIDYNPELDQIILSSHSFSEVWIIDHSTTALESSGHTGGRAGKGGDLLYRWGNPSTYNRGLEEDRTLYSQHDAQWIDPGLPGEGHILIFNNGDGNLRPYSTVIEIAPEMNTDGSYILKDGMYPGSEVILWEYNPAPPERFFSFFISGAQRLPNGNTLIDQGAGAKVREVTASGKIVWDYAYTDDMDEPHMLFRANKYPLDHPGATSIINASQKNN